MPQDEGQDASANGAVTQGVMGLVKGNKEMLASAALSAVGAVAAKKGPELVRRLTQSTEERGENAAEGAKQGIGGGGGVGGIAGKALSKTLGGGGGGSKKTRRLPIQRWTDVAVPVDKAYEAWTNFDEFPKFMHRVLSVEQKGRDRVSWQEKIWFSKRQWEGQITERRENDRIVWQTKSGMNHKGIVSFHSIGDNLTRVMIEMEFQPTGMIEKMASGMRFVKRAVQADLARFKAYVEMEDAKGIEYRSGKQDDEQGGEKGNGGGQSRGNSSSEDPEEVERRRQERQQHREERRAGASA